jgi:phenylpropionate dioxygenase-like ring-hydroxylating dioxygenase large terminal subunit
MSRAELVAMLRHDLAHAAAGTVPLAEAVARIPATHYTDPVRWRAEVSRVFRRLPLMLALSCELAAIGDYKAMDVAGVPVLLTRGPDGTVRGFVNVCSHRGAVVVPDGTGNARRFACPYHAWTYDADGALVGILAREEFGTVDPSCLGLPRLPVAERAGLVFAVVDPSSTLDIDDFLSGYDRLLAHFGFEHWHLVSRRSVEGPNWKVAYDGYLDLYHLPVLHRNTFGPDIPNRAIYQAWGPHQRVTSPVAKLTRLLERPEDTWPDTALVGGVWTIFPHVSIATFDAGVRGVLVSQLFPGSSPGRSVTVQSYLVDHVPTDEEREQAVRQADFLEYVVREEDYATGLRIQAALEAGTRTDVLFGRNEGGGQRFHAWVARILDADDDALARLFPGAREHP